MGVIYGKCRKCKWIIRHRYRYTQNTINIVNQGCETENGGKTAAQAALDAEINDYSDWYLPSKNELLEVINYIDGEGSEDNWYWSSSQDPGSDDAWGVIANTGWSGSPHEE